MAAETRVLVEVVELDGQGARQIGPRKRATELLRDRSTDIEEAVREASAIAQRCVAQAGENKGGWTITTLQATFGLTLTAEAGVILSKASAEASFEVSLTVERKG